MRILLVTSNFPRWDGDSTTPFVLHLAQGIQDLGARVDVLAPHAPGAARHEILGGVRVERFRYLLPESQQTVCYQGGALVNLRDRPTNALKLPALVAAEWAALASRLWRRRYDVVNSHWILPQGFVAALAARPLGIAHVTTVHGGDIFALRGAAMRAFKRSALRQADAVTVNSSVTREAVLAVTDRIRHLETIPMGVRAEPAPAATAVASVRERHRSDGGPLLAFAGRLVEEKGVEDLVRAVRLLRDRLPGTSLIVIGEGQHRARFERVATEEGVADRVRFAGWLPPGEVRAHLAAADIVVAPSRQAPDGWIEAQGLTVVEAMTAGTPVIASRSGGVVDAVRDGETGLLVPERSPEAIAAAVERIVRDPTLAGRLARAGADLAQARFSQRATAEAFVRLFERVRAARGSR
ncbi:MAG TPA: glycosyltransferase family 4 protein [Actinomycetota bacterium]|nr:glycosyltransferase family 4 protein [Actinomycetota bacterium]